MVRFDRSSRAAIAADYVVCSIPATILKTIQVQPRFPHAKERALRDVIYDSVMKVFLQTRTWYWSQNGLSGFAATDLPVDEFWDLSQPKQSQRGLMVAYTTGRSADHLENMNEAKRISLAAAHARAIFTGMSDQLEGGMSYCWNEDKWAGGRMLIWPADNLRRSSRRLSALRVGFISPVSTRRRGLDGCKAHSNQGTEPPRK